MDRVEFEEIKRRYADRNGKRLTLEWAKKAEVDIMALIGVVEKGLEWDNRHNGELKEPIEHLCRTEMHYPVATQRKLNEVIDRINEVL